MTTTRREWLAGLAAAGLAGALPAAIRPAGRGYPWPLGVQLYSVKAELDGDLDGTLRQLVRMGYREAETAGLHGRTPEQFRAAATQAGLRLVSAHYSMPDLFADATRPIAEARAMGVQWLVASSPRADRPVRGSDWITSIHDAMTLDAWRKNAARMNKLGRSARAAGLGFAYHNHPVEFDRYDGQRGIDVLLAGTDPALVKLELDVAWAVAGGVDPVRFIAAHPDRLRMIHVKGLRTKPVAGRFGTDFTTGVVGRDDVVDWPAVFAAAKRVGVQHAFVEQEPPYVQPVLQSLMACRDYLEHL